MRERLKLWWANFAAWLGDYVASIRTAFALHDNIDAPPPTPLSPAEAITTFAHLDRVPIEEEPSMRQPKKGEQVLYRSSVNGLIVSADYAKANPATTYRSIVKMAKRPKPAKRHK